jgi:hypothetical protein
VQIGRHYARIRHLLLCNGYGSHDGQMEVGC